MWLPPHYPVWLPWKFQTTFFYPGLSPFVEGEHCGFRRWCVLCIDILCQVILFSGSEITLASLEPHQNLVSNVLAILSLKALYLCNLNIPIPCCHNYLGYGSGKWMKVGIWQADPFLFHEDHKHPHETGAVFTYPLLVWRHERSESHKNTRLMGMLWNLMENFHKTPHVVSPYWMFTVSWALVHLLSWSKLPPD